MKNALRVLIKTIIQSISIRSICRSDQIDFDDWKSVSRMLKRTDIASKQTCLKETMSVMHRRYISAKLYNLARRIRDKDSRIIMKKLDAMLCMHPSSIIAENGFDKYTTRFAAIVNSRIAIKHMHRS